MPVIAAPEESTYLWRGESNRLIMRDLWEAGRDRVDTRYGESLPVCCSEHGSDECPGFSGDTWRGQIIHPGLHAGESQLVHVPVGEGLAVQTPH